MSEDREEDVVEFNRVYAELQKAQAEIATFSARTEKRSDDDDRMDALQDVECAAIWQLIRTPAIHKWQIRQKLEVLEYLMQDNSDWTDQREHFLLASARLDL